MYYIRCIARFALGLVGRAWWGGLGASEGAVVQPRCVDLAIMPHTAFLLLIAGLSLARSLILWGAAWSPSHLHLVFRWCTCSNGLRGKCGSVARHPDRDPRVNA